MSPYILNLTNHLIGKYNFDHDRGPMSLGQQHNRIDYLKIQLETHGLRGMKAETLGKIMSELDIGDVMATKEEIFKHVGFYGDCENLLREVVATCLAYTISERLSQTEGHLPRYRRRKAD
jgi:hypothetical protein